MRLLNSRTKRFHVFFDETERPPYAILSHRWNGSEVTLKGFQQASIDNRGAPRQQSLLSKEGLRKIQECCRIALENGLEWVWIDTCCIDKTDNAELQEAINSMFRWYQASKVCYTYLDDVSSLKDITQINDPSSSFRQSAWFTRSWTLQELLAPPTVIFYDSSWKVLGDRSALRHAISDITRIPVEILQHRRIKEASVAQRMCWAASRKTTRLEDRAYSLLGIFDVNLPLLYGEGEKAFKRLQEAIIEQESDQSIFAWGFGQIAADNAEIGALAKSPDDFIGCANIVPCRAWSHATTRSCERIENGFRMELPLAIVERQDEQQLYGLLNCRLLHDFSYIIAIPFGHPDKFLGSSLVKFGKQHYVRRFRKYPPIRHTAKMLRWSNQYVVHISMKASDLTTLHDENRDTTLLVQATEELDELSAKGDGWEIRGSEGERSVFRTKGYGGKAMFCYRTFKDGLEHFCYLTIQRSQYLASDEKGFWSSLFGGVGHQSDNPIVFELVSAGSLSPSGMNSINSIRNGKVTFRAQLERKKVLGEHMDVLTMTTRSWTDDLNKKALFEMASRCFHSIQVIERNEDGGDRSARIFTWRCTLWVSRNFFMFWLLDTSFKLRSEGRSQLSNCCLLLVIFVFVVMFDTNAGPESLSFRIRVLGNILGAALLGAILGV